MKRFLFVNSSKGEEDVFDKYIPDKPELLGPLVRIVSIFIKLLWKSSLHWTALLLMNSNAVVDRYLLVDKLVMLPTTCGQCDPFVHVFDVTKFVALF